MGYPVVFDAERPEQHARVQVVIRILILILLSILGSAAGVLGLLYLAVPVLAAILISQKGARAYLDDADRNVGLWLRYVVAFFAYMLLLTDRLPTEDPKQIVRFEFTPDAEPTAGGVLVRIITAIPHAIVLAILGIVSAVLWVIAAAMVLVQERYPEGIWSFQRGFLRWEARVIGYLAGFAQAYPPFAFDTGPEAAAPPAIAAGEPTSS